MSAFMDTVKDVALVIGIVAAGFAALKWTFGAGEKKQAIESSISSGFASVKQEVSASIAEVKISVSALGERVAGQIGSLTSRMDRFEARAEAEAKERAAAAAVDAERRAREAAEHGQAAERSRQLEADVTELSGKVDDLARTIADQHRDVRDRLGAVEARADQLKDGLDKMDGHVKGTQKALQDHQTRLAVIEREARTPESAE